MPVFVYGNVICVLETCFKRQYFFYNSFFDLLLFKITDARTSFILVLFFSFIVLLNSCTNILDKLLKKIKSGYLYLLFLLIVLSTITLSIIYTPYNSVLLFFDKILNGRLELANVAFDSYGFNLFGHAIHWVGSGTHNLGEVKLSEYNFVDCSYMKNILDFGLFFTLIVILGYILLINNFFKKKNTIGLLIVYIISVVCIFEPRLIQLEFNPFIILLSEFLTLSNKDLKNKYLRR